MEDKLPSEPIHGGFRPILPIPDSRPGFTYHLYRSPSQFPKPVANKMLRLRRQIPPLFQDLISDGAIVMGSSDVEFICKGGEIAKAHRVVLSLMSPFFCNLFRKQKPNKTSFVSVPDIECETMRSILLLCYKRDVSLSSEHDVLSVMTWVEEFGINRSSLRCGLINALPPSTIQRSDMTNDPNNRQPPPMTGKLLPALVSAPFIASGSAVTPGRSQQSGQDRQHSDSTSKQNEDIESNNQTIATTPKTPNRQQGTALLRYGLGKKLLDKFSTPEGDRTKDSSQPRVLVRVEGLNNYHSIPALTYWMDSDERKVERSTDSNAVYLSPAPMNLSQFSPVNAVLNIQQQSNPVSTTSTPPPRRYSPDITRAHRDGRNSQYQSPRFNTPVRNPDSSLLTCPFCKILMVNATIWRSHVYNCGISESENTPDSKKRTRPKEEKEFQIKRRMSGRQTSLPIPLRDHYVKESRSPPPALIDSKTSLQRQIAAFAPTKKYLRLKKQQAIKTKARRTIKGALSTQKLKSYRAAATRIYRTAPRVPAECLKSAERADEQERIRWLYVCLQCELSLDSSIKAHAHYLKCTPEKKYEDSVIKYRQGYYGGYECPLCPRKYTTIYGFVVHCIHNHSEYKKLLSHVISEDKLMCINCGDKFSGPTDFHEHLQDENVCSKPPKEELSKRKYKKMLNRRGLESPIKRLKTAAVTPIKYQRLAPRQYLGHDRIGQNSDRSPYGLQIFDFTDASASMDEDNSPRIVTKSDVSNIFRSQKKLDLTSTWADYEADSDSPETSASDPLSARNHCPICKVATNGMMNHFATNHRDMGIDIRVVNKEIIQCQKCSLSFAHCDLLGHIKVCAESTEMDESNPSALDLTQATGPKTLNKPKAELVYPVGLGNSPLDSFDLSHITGSGLLQAFRCPVCHKAAKKLALVADCLKKHGVHRCPICFNTYFTKERCNQHYHKCHFDSHGRAFCPICLSTRSNIGQLANHMYQVHWPSVYAPGSPESFAQRQTPLNRTETFTSVTAEDVRTADDREEIPEVATDIDQGTSQSDSSSVSTVALLSPPNKVGSSPEPSQLVEYPPSPSPPNHKLETDVINARKWLAEAPPMMESDSAPSIVDAAIPDETQNHNDDSSSPNQDLD